MFTHIHMFRNLVFLVGATSSVVLGTSSVFPGCRGGTLEHCPGVVNCTTHWLTQNIDHFNWAPPLGNSSRATFDQRYFVYDKYWDKANHGPVFFYFGNEDNVELYVNHTGLMWESAEAFGALLVFGEHRFYGETLPFAPGTARCMNFLTTEQAMADFAYLIDHLREAWGAGNSAFIGFGGSYGGMLASWFRIHYPNAIDGVIAGSAPIWSFVGLHPAYDYNSFNAAVTYDTTTAGGASPHCNTNLKAAWPRILRAAESEAGRAILGSAFRTCAPVRPRNEHVDDGLAIVRFVQDPWANMAMGNYPYASSYLMHGKSLLPPWPVRAACKHISAVGDATTGSVSDTALFNALRAAVAVQYNNTGDIKCFPITGRGRELPSYDYEGVQSQAQGRFMSPSRPTMPHDDLSGSSSGASSEGTRCQGSWGYQWCTEMTQPFTQGTSKDFFYCPNGTFHPKRNCSAWSVGAQGCFREWGVRPRPEWARVALGGKRISEASNIVFSNGLQDPWHPGGVLRNLSDSVLAILIPNGAHHIDLMFSDPEDTHYPDIGWARDFERTQIKRWVTEHDRKRDARLRQTALQVEL